jgi:hypothetical protein
LAPKDIISDLSRLRLLKTPTSMARVVPRPLSTSAPQHRGEVGPDALSLWLVLFLIHRGSRMLDWARRRWRNDAFTEMNEPAQG